MSETRPWPDKAAKALLAYFCICGWVLFMLDYTAHRRSGVFETASEPSLQSALWLFLPGLFASIAIVLYRPTQPVLFVLTALAGVVFAAGVAISMIARHLLAMG